MVAMTSPRILLTRRWPAAAERALASRYEVQVNRTDRPLTSHELGEALRQFDILCPTVTDRLDLGLLRGGPLKARALCNYGAGFGHIDVDAFGASGIIVTNTPDVLTGDTADLTMLLILMCARRAGEGERLVRSGLWQGWAPTHLLGTAISGKTLGIVGFGRIGQAVARRARHGFGMNILYSSPGPAPAQVKEELGALPVDVDRLFAASDVVSLHLPGGPVTRNLVDARRLGLMRRSGILINTARGEIVDERALAGALCGGAIAAAGLDVHDDEPNIHPELLELDNVVLLPHLGSATRESRVAMGMRVKANVDAIAAGLPPPDRVG
jgi:lactate dehydrogenase-like 2-hydroxyacid dehydrogenase